MGMKKRFLKTFSSAVIIGLLYGFTSIWIQGICISKGIHLYMRIDVAIDLLKLLAGNTVLIYGFFAAFLLFIITEIPKISDEGHTNDPATKKRIRDEAERYNKLISDKMNIFIWITGFVVTFFFFLLNSIAALELQKYGGGEFFDLPAVAPAFIIYFMFIIALLGYLVFSLVMGALEVGGDQGSDKAEDHAGDRDGAH